VQPKGLELGKHRSQCSDDSVDRGVHVFGSLSELCGGVQGWLEANWTPEVIEIECDENALADNGDYEGYVLLGNRGEITNRKSFKNWSDLITWSKDFPETF
jgi:hypothetical protein